MVYARVSKTRKPKACVGSTPSLGTHVLHLRVKKHRRQKNVYWLD